MSDLRVALIAEGPTDAIVIEAALKALLPRPFVMTQLQPEPTRPRLGTGWGVALVHRVCIAWPSKASDAWLASAVLAAGHKLLDRIECNMNLEAQLGALPNAARVRKTMRAYRALQNQITPTWPIVRQQCSQAERFSNEIVAMAL